MFLCRLPTPKKLPLPFFMWKFLIYQRIFQQYSLFSHLRTMQRRSFCIASRIRLPVRSFLLQTNRFPRKGGKHHILCCLCHVTRFYSHWAAAAVYSLFFRLRFGSPVSIIATGCFVIGKSALLLVRLHKVLAAGKICFRVGGHHFIPWCSRVC